MLLSEFIYNIKNLKAGGLHSDSVKLSDEQYIFIGDYYRAKLIRQYKDKSIYNLEGFTQSLNSSSAPIKLIKNTTEPFISIGFDRVTEKEIPDFVLLSNGLAITYVGPTSGGLPYDKISRLQAQRQQFATYTSKVPTYTLEESKIYIKSGTKEGVSNLAISGVFERPLDVYKFRGDNIDLNYDIDYPLPIHLVDTIYKMMIESEVKLSEILPKDIVNDSQEAMNRK